MSDAHDVPGARLTTPAISVVVPSYNRRRSLELVLVALAAQRGVPPGAMEVVVALDGSTDDSAAMLAGWESAGRLPGLRWLALANGGQAAARHAGVLAAHAPVVLFLDDDVVPEPDVVAHHLAGHARGDRVALLGDCEIVPDDMNPFYQAHVWAWWEELYASRVRPGRVPCWPDFCAGHVSLRRDDYLATGGFDPDFRGYGGEDYELGYRLLRAGVRFEPSRALRAWHHHRLGGDYARLLRQRQQEGVAQVLLARKHPELAAGLRLGKRETGMRRLDRLVALAFTERGMSPARLDLLARRIGWYERFGLRERWWRELTLVGAYAFWRGVRLALGSRAAHEELRRGVTVPVQVVDVAHGLPDELPGFWVDGPSDVQVVAAGEPLGTVRLPGPVLQPLREALAGAIETQLGAGVWAWAERTGASLLPASRD